MRSLVSTYKLVLLGVVLGAGVSAFAATPSQEVDNCLRAAATKHGISYVLIRSIAEQESSFNPHAVRRPLAAGNLDRSTDYGLMQINSSWLKTLSRYGVTAESLFRPCVNADVGAWILADNFRRLGVTWQAVGAYNALTPWKQVKYATGVYNKAQRYSKQTTGTALPYVQVSPPPQQAAAPETQTAVRQIESWEAQQ